jgi:uncharacterized protein (DUF433 family)
VGKGANILNTVAPEKVDLSKYIELGDDRPCVRGRRLPVIFVAAAQQANNLSIADLAYQFTLSEEQVLAALLYYREHQAELDAQDATDAQESMEMHRRYANKPGQV